jgi:hypothetical protein
MNKFFARFLGFSVNNHESFKKIFLDIMRGGGEGFLVFFWPKFTKNVTGEGGGGQNVKKTAKFTFFVNPIFKYFLLKILGINYFRKSPH